MLAAGWLGTLPGWLTVIGLLIAAATFARGTRSTAVTNLKVERDELDREVKKLTVEVSTLRATRDLAPLQSAMIEALASHENRAQSRSDKIVEALDQHLKLTGMIADRLGPNHTTP